MMHILPSAKTYSVVILKTVSNIGSAGVKKIIWEHGRRNFSLRADGLLSIVCPVSDGTEIKGIAIFNTDEAATKKIMDEYPGVMEGVFVYEVHPCRSFPAIAF